MPAYIVATGRIDDQERFGEYIKGVAPTMGPFGGKLLALEDSAEILEGNSPHPRVVVVEFPTMDDARNWYNSADYQKVLAHRLASSEHVLYAVNGFTPPA
jgi:uncharacterized protein (DUF1330 family)